MTGLPVSGSAMSCRHNALNQGRSDGGYIGIYTLPKSGQVNFYGVKRRLNGY